MIKYFFLIMLCASSLLFVGCKKDDPAKDSSIFEKSIWQFVEFEYPNHSEPIDDSLILDIAFVSDFSNTVQNYFEGTAPVSSYNGHFQLNEDGVNFSQLQRSHVSTNHSDYMVQLNTKYLNALPGVRDYFIDGDTLRLKYNGTNFLKFVRTTTDFYDQKYFMEAVINGYGWQVEHDQLSAGLDYWHNHDEHFLDINTQLLDTLPDGIRYQLSISVTHPLIPGTYPFDNDCALCFIPGAIGICNGWKQGLSHDYFLTHSHNGFVKIDRITRWAISGEFEFDASSVIEGDTTMKNEIMHGRFFVPVTSVVGRAWFEDYP